jgi:MCP family monocarboxylic acid transporter-like MFS transporter 10
MAVFGSFLYTFSVFMLSLCERDQYYQVFLAQGLGMGLGQSFLFLPSLTIVSHHFRRRRALATGIVVTGASAGGVIFPIMLNRLFQNPSVGFNNGVRVSAGVIGTLLLIANLLVRTRLPPKQAAAFEMGEISRIVGDGILTSSIAGCVL